MIPKLDQAMAVYARRERERIGVANKTDNLRSNDVSRIEKIANPRPIRMINLHHWLAAFQR